MVGVESAADLAVFFNTGEFAESGTYRAGGTGDPETVSVIPDLGTRRGDLHGADIVTNGATFLVRVSDIASPASGDTLVIGATTYTFQGTPELDYTESIWHIEARPS